MGKNEWRRRGLLGAGVLGAAFVYYLLLPRGEEPIAPTPATPPTTQTPIAAATEQPVARASDAPRVAKSAPGVRQSYIVQASSLDVARRAVERAGGVVTGELEIIRAVGAELDDRELAALWKEPVAGLRVYDDASVSSSYTTAYPETYYPTQVGASTMHTGGVTGRGVTVAVIDTGVWDQKGPLQQSSSGRNPRVLAQYDVILARENPQAYPLLSLNKYSRDIDDINGHGTHVSSIIASSGIAPSTGRYQGVAPGVNLVSVRVLDSQGMGRYFDVIAGIQWVVNQRLAYGIRVINLSLSGPVQSHYWDDPLNQAVMAAWNAGIVVVVAAGNDGPAPMTIGVPGNNPYVITVGAVTDSYHPYQPSKYRLATFSSAGPTYEGFVKPEVVAMGGHIRAYAPDDGTLAQTFTQWLDTRYPDLTMSGTSQAAAVTSGVVALMLEANPWLTPDKVKCRLMDGSRPAVRADGTLAYSVFQQGAGLVNAQDAIYSTASNCANQGLNVALDLAGLQHFGGRANRDADGNYYIMEVEDDPGLLGSLLNPLGSLPLLGQLIVGLASTLDGLLWDGSPPTSEEPTWSDSYTWSGGFTWSKAYTWSDGYTWSKGFTSSSTSAPTSSGIEPAPQE